MRADLSGGHARGPAGQWAGHWERALACRKACGTHRACGTHCRERGLRTARKIQGTRTNSAAGCGTLGACGEMCTPEGYRARVRSLRRVRYMLQGEQMRVGRARLEAGGYTSNCGLGGAAWKRVGISGGQAASGMARAYLFPAGRAVIWLH
jgi:hypothetical protein